MHQELLLSTGHLQLSISRVLTKDFIIIFEFGREKRFKSESFSVDWLIDKVRTKQSEFNTELNLN